MKSNQKSASQITNHIVRLYQSTAAFVGAAPISLKIIAITSLYALLVLSFGLYAAQIIPDNSLYVNTISHNYYPTGAGSNELFVHWDTALYINVIQQGYDQLTAAFFPLYLAIGAMVTNIAAITPVMALTLVSLSSTVLLAVVLYHWAKFEFQQRKIKASPWLVLGLVAIFPTAFYLLVPYNESLFMLLTVGALFMYRKGNHWIAALLAGLSSATRPQGILIGLYFALDYLLTKDWRNWRKLLPVAGVGLGVLSYMIYLWCTFDNPFAFITAQQYWGRFSSDPIQVFLWSLDRSFFWHLPVFFIALAFVWKHLDRPLFWYSLSFLLLSISTGSLQSLNRYMLTCLPLFLAAAIAWPTLKPVWRGTYVFSCGILMAFNIVLFFNNYWVA